MDATFKKQFGFCRLDHLGVIRAIGADAASFLHGQLTQDVIHLTAGEARLAAYCSAKGRMLASFVLLRTGNTEFLLLCSKDILPSVLKRIQMFVMRAKVTLCDASEGFVISGHLSHSAAVSRDAISARASAWPVAVDGDSIRIQLPTGPGITRVISLDPLTTDANLETGDLPLAQWLVEEVRSGVAMVGSPQSDLFIPQMLNYESIGAVNFKKGCYPGQEVVARSQFRGAIKRRAFIFESQGPTAPGDDVIAGDGLEQIGTVVSSAAMPLGFTLCIACVQAAAVSSESVQINGYAARPLQLPYELATDI